MKIMKVLQICQFLVERVLKLITPPSPFNQWHLDSKEKLSFMDEAQLTKVHV